MNNLRNSVNLIGILSMDPEIKLLDNGRKLACFTLPKSESFKNSEGKQIKETQWHQIVARGGSTTIAEKLVNTKIFQASRTINIFTIQRNQSISNSIVRHYISNEEIVSNTLTHTAGYKSYIIIIIIHVRPQKMNN